MTGIMPTGGEAPMTVIRGDGTVEFSDEFGDWHRDGGLPALIYPDGGQEWWVHGCKHRDNGLPAVDSPIRGQEWWVEGRLHRAGGLPAVVRNSGSREWWEHGLQHRVEGPARVDGDGWARWYWRGTLASEERQEALSMVHRTWGKRHGPDGDTLMLMVGSDPWIATVLSRNPELMRRLSRQQAAFLALLASTLRA